MMRETTETAGPVGAADLPALPAAVRQPPPSRLQSDRALPTLVSSAPLLPHMVRRPH